MTDIIQVIQLIGNVAGVGALVVFMVLGYRIFTSSVARSQAIDDDTIADLKRRIGEADDREEALRRRIDAMEKREAELRQQVQEMSDQFLACKNELVSMRAFVKLNYGIDTIGKDSA